MYSIMVVGDSLTVCVCRVIILTEFLYIFSTKVTIYRLKIFVYTMPYNHSDIFYFLYRSNIPIVKYMIIFIIEII